MNIFKLPEDALFEIASAKIAHKKWVNRLYKMYYGGESINPSEVTDYKKCRFGKRYYGTGASQCGRSSDFTSIENPHIELHRKAKSAVESFIRRDKASALSLIEEVDDISREIITRLDNLSNNIAAGTRGGRTVQPVRIEAGRRPTRA